MLAFALIHQGNDFADAHRRLIGIGDRFQAARTLLQSISR